MDKKLLTAIQRHTARAAITSSSMRGAGSPGVVEKVRAFLGEMPLRPFGTSNERRFLSHLDAVTESLREALPAKVRRSGWGRARKGLNIFLRDCLYTTYLRDANHLALAEDLFEMPLDSITGKRVVEESRKRGWAAPARWTTVRSLTPTMSAAYQKAAAALADEQRCARVHLDAKWWGERAKDE
jgi:hypothetical protein